MTEQPISKQKLRTGFTTGTCATASSKAAALAIITQKKINSVEVSLPKGNSIKIKIQSCKFDKKSATCSVIKDAGDDPDVTHGAEIFTEVSISGAANKIEILGGDGVGIVTKPGLGLEIGQPAINPTPKKMITQNLIEACEELLKKNGIKVTISVPKGKELALKTDNPRLGIMEGISILGTTGIVVPYSTASFAASIRQNIDVCIAMKDYTVVLTTGGRSEDFSKKIIDLPEHCFVQMGDFSGYAISQCAKKNIKKAFLAGFIGKFAKMATGVKQTHVKGSKVDTDFLAKLAEQSGANEKVVKEIKLANTARHVQDIVSNNNITGFFNNLCIQVHKQMMKHSEQKLPIEVILFNFDGKTLGRYS